MLNVNNIPHLKVVRTRVYYPQLEGNVQQAVIFNTSTPKQMGEILKGNSTLIHLNKFNRYYVPNSYKANIFNRITMENLYNQRYKMYEEVKAEFGMMRPELDPKNTTKALCVDMSYWNKLYHDLVSFSYSYSQRYTAYIDVLKLVLRDDEIKDFTKTMMIDLEQWGSFKNNLGNYRYLNTPLLLLYYTLWKDWALFKSLGDVDIIFTSSQGVIRINPALVGQDSFRTLKIELMKLSNSIEWDTLEKEVAKSELSQDIQTALPSKYNFTGSKDTNDAVDKAISDIVDKAATDEESKANISTVLNDDKELSEVLTKHVIQHKSEEPTLSKRDELLRDKQRELTLKGTKLEDIISDNKGEIPSRKIERETINENVKEIRFPNFHKTYNEEYLSHDMLNMIMSMNDAQIPVYLRDIKVEDTSNEMSFKETYTVSLEDANRVRHTLTFDMPKFVDDKFLYLNGNRKVINNQLLMKPIIKTKEDEVQIVTNYNKIFLRRYGAKLSKKTEKLRKTFLEAPNVKRGNNSQVNSKYMTTIEYDDISRNFTYIKVGACEIYFKQQTVNELAVERNIKVPDGKMLIGFEGRTKPILVNLKNQMIDGTDMDIVDFILSKSTSDIKAKFDDATTGKKFLYTRATVMAKQVPLILLLGYCEGLSTVLRKAEIKHYFTDKRPKLEQHEGMVQFEDGYLVYDLYPFENSLLMNAFADIPTKGFNYAELDSKESYGAIFETMFNQRNLASAFDNFYDFMIDPITREILKELDYPTEFVGVMLYANKLMSDNAFVNENDLSLYRIRSNELVNVFLYKAITDAYGEYRRTAYNNNPTKISIRKDHVLKSLLMAQTVEDYSVLNPIVEIEKVRVVSPKGPSGLNLSQAYTLDKRGYDPSMVGTIAMSTSPDANVGVVRQLSLEPKIRNARGFIDIDRTYDSLKDTNIFSPAEMLSPLGASRDDSSRTAMAVKQSKHIIPVKKSSPVLISNGSEQTIHHHLSHDFAVVAKGDGVVKEVDEKTGLVIVEYSNGDKEAFDTTPKIVKNGAGGFFLENKLDLKFKQGDKFKRDDIIAADEKFFSDSIYQGNKFNIGSLQKIAVMGGYYTYEDSTAITSKLSRDLASDIVMIKEVTLGKNSNVEGLVKKGQKINVGDELLKFETSFEDESINEMLRSMGDDLKEQVMSLGKKPITSKYTGTIVDVKIYSTVDMEELSPSLQKILKDYHGTIKAKHSVLNKHDKSEGPYKMGMMLTEPTKKIDTADGKVKGNIVGEGVLIQIYIRYEDTMGVGDKLAYFTALKSIVGEVIPEGYEPWSEYRPDEEISCFLAPAAILARMTPSVLITMLGNKVLVELKRHLQDIYEDK